MAREWLAIDRGATKGKHAKKRVEKSDFKKIRKLPPGEEGDGLTIISYRPAGLWLGQTRFRGTTYQTLEIPGAGNIEIKGAPELPQEGLLAAIPENADVAEVVFRSEGRWTHRRRILVRPVSEPVRGREEPQYIQGDIYTSDEPYPGGSPGRLIGIKRIAGRKVAHIMLYPVQYRPKVNDESRSNLVAHESIEIRITYRKKKWEDPVAPRRILQTAPVDRLILDSASQLEAERERLMRETHSHNCSDLRHCNNEGEYLIIIPTEDEDEDENLWRNAVQPLAQATTYRSPSVKVVTKKDILDQFHERPEDRAILEFLRCAYCQWETGPRWVILAGDTTDIPTHLQRSEENTGAPAFASDHFYEDLWGQLFPELEVSRLATSDPQVMETICRKIAEAPSHHDSSWENKILFITYNESDFKGCSIEVANKIRHLYEVMPPVPVLSGPSAIDDTKTAINNGVGLVSYLGHGWKKGWEDVLQDTHLSELTLGWRLPVVFSIACETNCIDYDENPSDDPDSPCFGESWLRNGKAVAFLGASRKAYHDPDLAFQRHLFDAMILQKLDATEEGEEWLEPFTEIGDIMNFAKTRLCSNSSPYDPQEETWYDPLEEPWHDPMKEMWMNEVKVTASDQVIDNIRAYLLLGDPCATFGEIAE